MAGIVLTAVIGKTTDVLATCAVEDCSRLYWMKEDVEWIQREMKIIGSFLKDADENQGKSEGVAAWVIEVKDLAYDIEDIIDIFFPNIATHKRNGLRSYLECFGCIFCNWYTSHSFVITLKSIKGRVENINRAIETYGITANNDSQGVAGEEWDPRRSFAHVEEPIIVGFEKHIESLKNLLVQNEQYCVIPIVGLPGVGKTTLAKKVYNSIKEKIPCHAWVYASRNPRVKDILRDIARQVEVEKEQWENEVDLEANLSEFLNQRTYLIVIDDIWTTDTWDALKVGIPDNRTNGSALIISSRNKNVGDYIGGEYSSHEVQPLDDERSWELFSYIVKLPPQSPVEAGVSPKLLELGREILRRCGGLPLRIVAMGGLLSRKERMEHIWEGLLKKMGQEGDQTLTIVRLSYSDLPSYLKLCFLYLGLFPEDHVYHASELINLWIAEGYIHPQENHTLDDVGENFLTELISRYLIQIERRRFDGTIRSCRIHDVVHSLCVSIAKENDVFNTCDGDYSSLGARVRRLAIHHGSFCEYISKHQSPNLRALLSLNKDEEILRGKNFVHFQSRFRLIRVLCLEGLVFPRSLPSEMYNLIHLRYLRLTGSGLTSLSSTIRNLKNLQTLDVQGFENLNLPAVIWKMQSLRHILLHPTISFQGSMKSKHIGHRSKTIDHVCVPDLQSLTTLNGDFLEANCLGQFTNIRKLGICCCMKQFANVLTNTLLIPKKLEKLQLEVWDDGPYDVNQSRSYDIPGDSMSHYQNQPKPAGPLLNFSAGYENLRNLYLEGPLVNLPEFTTSLTKLTLVRSRLEQDPMEELGKLPNLKKLQLRRSCYMGHTIAVSGASAFPQLEFLVIEPMPFLKALKVEEGVMPRLKHPIINCDITLEIHSGRLKNIFSEFNAYLMQKSFLELDIDFALPDDDFFLGRRGGGGGGFSFAANRDY